MYESKKYNNFYKSASTLGLIMGLATAAIHFIFYLLEYKMSQPLAIILLTLLAVIVTVVYGTIKYRNSLGGYISYFQAFIFGVMIFLFAGIVGAVYSYVFNNIDPDYVYRQLETYRGYLLNSGFTEIKVDEIITESKAALDYQMQHPFQSIFSSACFNTFIGAIFCLISSAFLRKSNPNFNNLNT